jgi:microcin C transport system permease protein
MAQAMTGATIPSQDRFLGLAITPLKRRRIESFKANRRGYWSLFLFLLIFALSLCAELIANDKPIMLKYDGHYYAPFITSYP